MEVKLLECTPNMLDVIFMACRQCYNEGWVGNSWFKDEDSKNVLIIENEKVVKNSYKEKIIKHVFDSGHHSVLEHATFTFAIDGISRSLSHQLVRHRIASFSQQSQRYAGRGDVGTAENSKYIIPPKILKNKKCLEKYLELLNQIDKTYDFLLNEGIPSEDSRFVLPNATPTRIVMTMNIRSLIHFFEERLCTCAQWEIRKMALDMYDICKKEFPLIFENIGPKCHTLGYCNENENRTCGRKPRKETFLNIKG